MPWVTIRYERNKLYEEVWAEPVTKVAKRYGISDVALRKTCKQLSVPLPPVGYWAQVAAGKIPRKPVLPKFSGPEQLIRNRRVSDTSTEQAPPEPEHLIVRREFEARPENKIVVTGILSDPHPLVAALQKSWSRKRVPDQRGWAQIAVDRRLDVSISDSVAPRAFCIFDALAKGLAQRGMPIRVDGQGARQTYVSVQGEDISFRVVEKSERTERSLNPEEKKALKTNQLFYISQRYIYTPTGLLSLVIRGDSGATRGVSDGKHTRVEDKLNAFVVMLEQEAVRRKRGRELRALQKQHWEEEWRRRQELEAKKAEERQKLAELEEDARQWRRAQELRAYVLAVEAEAISVCGQITPNSEFDQWAAWARRKADEIDPLRAIIFQ